LFLNYFINIIILTLSLTMQGCGTSSSQVSQVAKNEANSTALKTPNKENNITQTTLKNSLIEDDICKYTPIKFDFLYASELNPWPESSGDAVLLHYNPIKDAVKYNYDIIIYDANDAQLLALNAREAYSSTTLKFIYDASLEGWSAQSEGDVRVNSSKYFAPNARVDVRVHALDANAHELSVSKWLTLRISSLYPQSEVYNLYTRSVNGIVDVHWCGDAQAYNLHYGVAKESLNSERNSTTSQIMLSNLKNDTKYFFNVAAKNGVFTGKKSETLYATPSLQNSVDFSIDNVRVNQAVQINPKSESVNAPLIANKKTIIRMFAHVKSDDAVQKVDVKLTLLREGKVFKELVKSVPLRDASFSEADSSDFAITFTLDANETLDAQSSFFVQIDSKDSYSESDETNNRYPQSGEQNLAFVQTPTLKVKLIPVTTFAGSVSLSSDLRNKIQNYLEAMYPVSGVEVSVAKILDKSNIAINDNTKIWSDFLNDMIDIRKADINQDTTLQNTFYVALFDKMGSDVSGMAGLGVINDERNFNTSNFQPDLVSMVRVDSADTNALLHTIAHEIGHNLGRRHIDSSNETNQKCLIADNVDANYTYNSLNHAYARIGKSGYDSYSNTLHEKEIYHDIMSYCKYLWISDYTYEGIYNFLEKMYTLQHSARSLQAKTMYGIMISGVFDGKDFTISKKYNAKALQQSYTSEYKAKISFNDGTSTVRPIELIELDHTANKLFKLFIPTTKEIKNIEFL